MGVWLGCGCGGMVGVWMLGGSELSGGVVCNKYDHLKHLDMEVQINAIHFELGDELKNMVKERLSEIERYYAKTTNAVVTLREIRPGIPDNKEVMVSLMFPDAPDIVATKTGNTYEEATDACLDSLKRQLDKLKNRNRPI